MKKCRWMAWVIAAAWLTGCTGKQYEKIQGISEIQEDSSQTEKEGEGEESEIILLDEDVLEGTGSKDTGSENVGSENTSSENAGSEDTGAEGPETGEKAEDSIKEPLTFLFAGDVLLSNHVLNAYESAGGIQGVLDEGYREQIEKADFFLVNQEFPFSDRGTAAEDKQYTFRLPPARVSVFLEMGIDGVTLANNHALDFGREALLDSCKVLDQAGILHTGAGENLEAARRPVSVEIKDKKIAIIGGTRVIPVADWVAGGQHPGMLAAYDMTNLLEEISIQKQSHDFVAVCIHWGIERDERPQDYQRTMGQQMIDAGADLVVGSHPHVLQGIEYYKGKPIVYSLGNFVFGSSIPRTALLQVTWENQPDPTLRLIPGTSASGYTRMVTEEEKRQEFFRYMESISYGVTCGEDGTVIPAAK